MALDDNKTIKFTKSGVQSEDKLTRQKQMLTQSEWGKETRYTPRREQYIGRERGDFAPPQSQMRANMSVKANKSQDDTGVTPFQTQSNMSISVSSQGEQEYQSDTFTRQDDKLSSKDEIMGNPNVKLGSRYLHQKDTIVGTKPFTANTSKHVETFNSIRKSSSTQSLNRGFKHNILIKGVNTATVNTINDWKNDEEDSGKRVIGKSADGVRKVRQGYNFVTQKSKRVAKQKTSNNAVKYVKLRNKTINTTKGVQATKPVITAIVNTIKAIFSSKYVLVTIAVILVVILIYMMLSSLMSILFGSHVETSNNPDFITYVSELDSAFIDKINKEKEKYELSEVIGLDRVNSNVSDIVSLLCVDFEYEVALNETAKSRLQEYHKVLNTYSTEVVNVEVETPKGDDDSKEEKTTVEKVVITVITYTVADKMKEILGDDIKVELVQVLLDSYTDNQVGGDYEGGWTGDKMMFPLENYSYISSYYGKRSFMYNGQLITEFHTALDIPAPANTPILSAQKGKVIFAGVIGTYGNIIKIDHGDGVQTYYAHCNSFIAQVGDTVEAGTPIARVGSTGASTGNHVHFEVRVNGRHYNPLNFL